MKVVLDVNVWVSGLLWGGVPGRLFDLAAENKIDIYISEAIMQDIEEILARKKFQNRMLILDVTREELLTTVQELSTLCLTTAVNVPQLRDPDDTIIATALFANAKSIVTGDLDLLVLQEFNAYYEYLRETT